MSDYRNLRHLPDMDELLEIATRFEEARAGDPALTDADLGDLIRLVPGKRAIFHGVFQGRDAVFRLTLDPKSKAPAREWAEMTRLWGYMADGPCRVAEPLHFNGDHGLMVIERIAGPAMLDHMLTLDAADQAPFIPRAARWYAHHIAPTLAPEPASAARWVDKATRAAATQPIRALQKPEARILARMQDMAPHIDTGEWRAAICHGDFHANNLLVTDGALTGIDTGGSARLPIYKDAARFLTHMARRGVLPSGQRRFGVDTDGLDAITDALTLTEAERTLHLPFFLGFECLIRVENTRLGRKRLKLAQQMTDAMAEDLEALPV